MMSAVVTLIQVEAGATDGVALTELTGVVTEVARVETGATTVTATLVTSTESVGVTTGATTGREADAEVMARVGTEIGSGASGAITEAPTGPVDTAFFFMATETGATTGGEADAEVMARVDTAFFFVATIPTPPATLLRSLAVLLAFLVGRPVPLATLL